MDYEAHPVQAYLMSCYAYEELCAPFLTDAQFDTLGQKIAKEWDEIKHRHKHLIDRDSCMFTSGVTKPYHEWPLIILSATHQITNTKGGKAWQCALKRFEVVDDLI